ncbi:hypothetical protein SAMD00019534_093890 [Acytostelium subglobosum LB1]|uniref:hypothetical protein n=1 Tax=Acytostelium subglobosum LB1 TaxID=1410327 RepID=UPI000644E277|nr:hypothetical protein SAMD00019534_093890 [Acytostelium subglobosum LB1]GAM26214.1 hypothetical protein SAMD00019534_093890 [Acytostelium subglobosum LB1]|eukprot:XP_012750768.1 hypothetical protein SAMD00019534_093890 [Acytostelium subglobosum LB1]
MRARLLESELPNEALATSQTNNVGHNQGVFHNQVLCRLIFGHVSDIHKRWSNLPKPDITQPPTATGDDQVVPRITNTIKGGKLYADGDLGVMLQYNATAMFLEAFDRVADDYPVNNDLLSRAMRFNNTAALKRLAAHPNMVMSTKNLSSIISTGNVEMLQHYLAATLHHCVPDVSIWIGHKIDDLDEQSVRLLLKHISVDTLDGHRGTLSTHSFGKRGISLGVLKVLHEEFNCLYSLDSLWVNAMAHCARCNLVDSFKYMVDNIPTGNRSSFLDNAVKNSLKNCASNGNIEVFDLLWSSTTTNKYLSEKELNNAIRTAAKHGQPTMVDHLFKCLAKVTTESSSSRKQQIHLRQGEETPTMEMSEAMLQASLAQSIHNDDMINVEAQIDCIGELHSEMCVKMSTSMAQLITTYRSPRLTFKGQSLFHMVKAIGQPGSNITPEIVCQFIDNCDIPSPDQLKETFELAADCSLALLQRIHTHFNLPYTDKYLSRAVHRGLPDIVIYLASQQTDEDFISEAVFKLIAWHPITKDDLTLILDTLPFVKSNPEICAWAVCNPSFEVFKHVLSLFTNEQLEGTDHLKDLFTQALLENNSRYLDFIQQRFVNTKLEVPELDAQTLMDEASKNRYLLIERHLDSQSFTKLPAVQQHRTLHSLLYHSYRFGTTRIIKLCKDRIHTLEGVNVEQVDQEMDIDQSKFDLLPVAASPKLESTLHMVMSDEKLGKMIMTQIGSIHNKLGIDHKQVITGKQLLYNHNLRDYIKYGATEWFLQSYDDNGAKLRYNETLLLEAFARCDMRALNVLLTDPHMSLNGRFDKHFVTNVSSCSHPQWESVLEKYFQHLCLEVLEPADIVITGKVLAHVRHPSFLRKLIEMDVQLKPIDDDGERNKWRWQKPLKSSFTAILVDAWLTKQYAAEMLQLLFEHKLLTTRTCRALLLQAIERKLTPLIELLVSQTFGDGGGDADVDRDGGSDADVDGDGGGDADVDGDGGGELDADELRHYIGSLIESCCKFGSVESLDIVIAHVPSTQLEATLSSLSRHCKEAVTRGHFNILIRAQELLGSTFKPWRYIEEALCAGHMDIVNFILNSPLPSESSSTKGADDYRYSDEICISNIHHSILSIELIERLLSMRPIVNGRYNEVMASAIRAGNKELINMIERNDGNVYNTNYTAALATALDVGDFDTAKKIITDHPPPAPSNRMMWCCGRSSKLDMAGRKHELSPSIGLFCPLIERLGMPNSDVTESTFIELANMLTKHRGLERMMGSNEGDLVKALKIAASKSVATIKLVLSHLTNYDTKPDSLKHSISSEVISALIEECIKHSDTESIEYIIQMAYKVSSKNDNHDRVLTALDVIPLKITNIHVLTFLIDKQYYKLDGDRNHTLSKLVDWACEDGHLEVIRLVHQQCTTSEQIQRHLPSLSTIHKALDNSHHQVVHYLFEGDSSPFKQAMIEPQYLIPILNSIRDYATDDGSIRIISMCDGIISSLAAKTLSL